MLELGEESQHPSVSLAGFWSWVAWRSAYLTRLGALQSPLLLGFADLRSPSCAGSSLVSARWSGPASVILIDSCVSRHRLLCIHSTDLLACDVPSSLWCMRQARKCTILTWHDPVLSTAAQLPATTTCAANPHAGTIQNRIYVAINWTMTLLFGRDVSRW